MGYMIELIKELFTDVWQHLFKFEKIPEDAIPDIEKIKMKKISIVEKYSYIAYGLGLVLTIFIFISDYKNSSLAVFILYFIMYYLLAFFIKYLYAKEIAPFSEMILKYNNHTQCFIKEISYKVLQSDTIIEPTQKLGIIFISSDRFHQMQQDNTFMDFFRKIINASKSYGKFSHNNPPNNKIFSGYYGINEYVFCYDYSDVKDFENQFNRLRSLEETNKDYYLFIGKAYSDRKEMTIKQLCDIAYADMLTDKEVVLVRAEEYAIEKIAEEAKERAKIEKEAEELAKAKEIARAEELAKMRFLDGVRIIDARKFDYKFLQSNTIIQFNLLPAIIFVLSKYLLKSSNPDKYDDFFEALIGAIEGGYESFWDECDDDKFIFYFENIQPEMLDNVIQKLKDIEPIDKNSTLNFGYARYNGGDMTLNKLYITALKDFKPNIKDIKSQKPKSIEVDAETKIIQSQIDLNTGLFDSQLIKNMLNDNTAIPKNQYLAIVFITSNDMDKFQSSDKYYNILNMLRYATTCAYKDFWGNWGKDELIFYFSYIGHDLFNSILQKVQNVCTINKEFSLIVGYAQANQEEMPLKQLCSKAYDDMKHNRDNYTIPDDNNASIEIIYEGKYDLDLGVHPITFCQRLSQFDKILSKNNNFAIIFISSNDIYKYRTLNKYNQFINVLRMISVSEYKDNWGEYSTNELILYFDDIQPEKFSMIFENIQKASIFGKKNSLFLGQAQSNFLEISFKEVCETAYQNMLADKNARSN